jgi:hypothetical protein
MTVTDAYRIEERYVVRDARARARALRARDARRAHRRARHWAHPAHQLTQR